MINAQMVYFSAEALALVANDFFDDLWSRFPSDLNLWMVDQACLRTAVDKAVLQISERFGRQAKVRNLMRGLNIIESSGWNKDAFAKRYSHITASDIGEKLKALTSEK